MLVLMLALTGSADAADWGDPKPFVQPVLNASYVVVNGNGVLQLHGGAIGGFTIRDKDKPHWYSLTRASAIGTYGIPSSSIGADFRVGSFIGPDGKVVRFTTGPDVWYNGYGKLGSDDYFLPWSPGLSIRNTALFKISKPFKILAEVSPGWAFLEARQNPDLPVFTDMTAMALALINAGSVSLTAGVQRNWNAAGTQDVIILGAGLKL